MFREFAAAVCSAAVMAGIASCAGAQDAPSGRPRNPGPFQNVGMGGGGAMFAPSSSPHDPKLMFVNCDMSALYRSTDGGQTWKMIDFRQTGSNVWCRVVYHPKDPNVVYHNGKVSRDRGITWQPISPKAPGDVNEMAADPEDESLLLIGAGDGAHLSRDGGANWEKLPAVAGKVARFYVDPASPKGNRRIFVATSGGLWRSDDGGRSFQEKTAGLPGKDLRDLAGARTADGKKLALYGATGNGVFKSENLGDSWGGALSISPSAAAQYYLLGAAEGKPDLVYATCTDPESVFKSEDGGKTWKATMFRDYRQKEYNVENCWIVYSICFGWGGFHTKEDGFYVNPRHPDTVMWTDYGECIVTHDGGKSWRGAHTKYVPGQPPPTHEKPGFWQSVGMEVTTTWQYCIDPHNHKRHYICYTDIGFAISEDGGDTWMNNCGTSGIPWANTTYDLALDPDVPNLVWAAQSNKHDITGWFDGPGPGGVSVSTDAGYHWKKSSQGLPDAPCRSIVLDPKSPKENRTLYVTMYGAGVYKSADGGKSWTKKSEGIDLGKSNHVLYVKLHQDGTLFCSVSGMGKDWRNGTASGAVYQSKNGGDSWECISGPQPLHWSTDIEVDPRDSRVVYWGAISLAGKAEGGVYKTSDGGKTWARLLKDEDVAGKGGASYLHAQMLSMDPKNPDVLYLGTGTNGLWYTTDGGRTWKPFGHVPFQPVNHVAFDPDAPDFIYVTTFGGGVWRGKAPTAKAAPAAPIEKPEAKAPAPLPPPAVKPEALESWNGKLIARVSAATKDGARPAASLALLGQREEKVKLAGADAKSLAVQVEGNPLVVPWAKISARDRMAIALAVLQEKSAEDHVLVAVFALAAGRGDAAEDHFAEARAADAKGAELVEEARQALGLK